MDPTRQARNFFQLPSNFTEEDLAAAQKRALLQYHPDKGGSVQEVQFL
jgi:hypothetical protein